MIKAGAGVQYMVDLDGNTTGEAIGAWVMRSVGDWGLGLAWVLDAMVGLTLTLTLAWVLDAMVGPLLGRGRGQVLRLES